MLEFSDLPYQFVPPVPNPLIISLVKFANRRFALPGANHRLRGGVEVENIDAFRAARKNRTARFVLLPNHPTHSDPQVMTEVCRQLRVNPSFMAAYDVFARSKFNSWVMQRTGAFSVDREGSDRRAMKCAAEVLQKGKQPLVIFPEGNVYLCNDRVTPFAEGAAYIALRAQKALGEEVPVYAVPVALKYSYLEDVREPLVDALDSIAQTYQTELDREADLLPELKRISVITMVRHLKQRGHAPAASDALADEQIETAARQLVEGLEQKIELSPRPADDLLTRVRKIRAAVHAVRTDPEREIDQAAARAWAEEAMLALRILGYAGGYAAENPTLDRVAETIARLREDVTSQAHPPDGRRKVIARLSDPIDLREHLQSFGKKARGAINTLTAQFEQDVQSGLDGINAANQAMGTEPF